MVTDSAGIFKPDELVELRKKLTDFEKKTSNQIVVVTINGLGFETIEGYANGLFNENGIGQKGKDNGLLLLFSKMDRQVRIEVGYGLEPYITDAVASRIIRNTMIPYFKDENYFEGISNGTSQLIRLLNEPEALAEFKADMQQDEDTEQVVTIGFLILFASIFVGVGGFHFFKSFGRLIEVLRGILIGKLGLLPGLFLVFAASLSTIFGLIFVAVPLGIALSIYKPAWVPSNYVLDHPLLMVWFFIFLLALALCFAFVKILFFGKEKFKISLIENDKTYFRKTFSSSGSHSFGSGRSGGSSGGFSGGGGSSGGGGASGSW